MRLLHFFDDFLMKHFRNIKIFTIFASKTVPSERWYKKTQLSAM